MITADQRVSINSQSTRRVGNRASKITFFGMWTCTRCSKFLGFVTFFIDHNMILHRNSPAFCRKHWYSLRFSWISLFFASSIWALFFVKFEFRAGFGTTERVFFLQAIWFKIWAVLSARQPFMECSQRRCQHLTYVQRIGLKRPFFSVFTLGGMALFNIFQIPSMVPVCTFNTPDLRRTVLTNWFFLWLQDWCKSFFFLHQPG